MGQEQHDFYKVNSLTNLDKASPVEGTIVWDAPRSVWNGAMLLGAIVLGPLTFSWSALTIFLVTAGITLCAGHSVGFHRRLIHRSFECPKWLERTLVWLGTAVGMGGPLWTIRVHDGRDWAQRQADCHPFLKGRRGFWMDGLLYLHGRLVLSIRRVSIPARELATIPSIGFSTAPGCCTRFRSLSFCIGWAGGPLSCGASLYASRPARPCIGEYHTSRTPKESRTGPSTARWSRRTTCR